MKVIGLTGGIASGKSLVAATLQRLGAVIIDADKIAREIVQPGCPALADIRDSFGQEMILPDGQLDRPRLGRLIFSDPAARLRLNGITHGRIKDEITRRLAQLRQAGEIKAAVIDAALLLEIGMGDLADEIWLVVLAETEQLNRLMARDKLSRQAAQDRVDAQMSLAEKISYAHRLIDNNGSREETVDQVIRLWREIDPAS